MTFWSDHRGIIYGVRTIRVYELIQDLPYKEMSNSTRFPHHNHLVKEKIVQMILNSIVPHVFISSISFCIKMHKTSLSSNVTETCSCKRPSPNPQIN